MGIFIGYFRLSSKYKVLDSSFLDKLYDKQRYLNIELEFSRELNLSFPLYYILLLLHVYIAVDLTFIQYWGLRIKTVAVTERNLGSTFPKISNFSSKLEPQTVGQNVAVFTLKWVQ